MGLSKDKIIEWRGKYNYPENEDGILNSISSVKTADDFRNLLLKDGILKWKGALRTIGYYQSMDSSKWQVFFDIIRGSTTEPKETVKKIVAFSKKNMSYNGKSGGISYPVASTIVYFFSKGNCPIIDWRVVFALKNNGYNEQMNDIYLYYIKTIKGYQIYLDDNGWDNFYDLCHEIVSNLKIASFENDTSLRVLDKALWAYPDINNNLVQAIDGTKMPQHNGEDVKITKNYKTHADMIKEALEELENAKPKSIMDFIRRKYPDIEVKEKSFRADIIGCSINHSSSHHYPSMPKFLFFDMKNKTYRLDISGSIMGLTKTEILQSKKLQLEETD